MFAAANIPPEIMGSVLGPPLPRIRAAELPGIVSVEVNRLFPDVPEEIYLRGDDFSAVRRAAEQSLAHVDMTMIKPGDSVNLLCSEHGFSILGGEPYAEMLRTVKDVVLERTGCENIRLRFCVGSGLTEAREMIPYYKLDDYFEGRIKATWPFDRGVPIETEIGTLYGLARVYDADWFIHAHYDDPREVYFHRLIYRTLKSFAMSYARYETRSIYHMNFGSRSSNVVPRAIFESPFVQNKHAFTVCLATSPAGVTGVDADNDLHKLNSRLNVDTLKGYGKLMRLFAEIDECVAVLDEGRWPWYLHAGGLTSGNLFEAPTDHLDLDVGGSKDAHPLNPAVKALVVNHTWRDAFAGLAMVYPAFIADREVARGLPRRVASGAVIAQDLAQALELACQKSGTDKAIIFDGSYGSINLTPSMGEFLMDKASAVARKVDEELMPKWLRQRGIDI
ncbi:MAG: hypothetical protein JRK53_24045 [Deltaproteobacteria bacterium]|nr:hypothetical protein [Deltaproteobacteria bacterium]